MSYGVGPTQEDRCTSGSCPAPACTRSRWPAWRRSRTWIPGNFAVNVAAGAEHGYTLVWVVVGASLTASLVQYLAAKLGIATGHEPGGELSRSVRPGAAALLWFQAELVVIMTDLAELVGGAFALYLLFGIPMVWGALIVATFGFVRAGAADQGVRGVPAGAAGPVRVDRRAAGGRADPGRGRRSRPSSPVWCPGRWTARRRCWPSGIIGATVMPHALHFHSASGPRGQPPRGAPPRWLPRAARGTRSPSPCRVAALANVSLVLIAAQLPAEASGGLTEAYAVDRCRARSGGRCRVRAGAAGVGSVVDDRRHLHRAGRDARLLAAADLACGCGD